MKKNWICIISKVITFWIPQTPFIAPETFKIWLQNRSETKKWSLFGSSKLHLSLLKRSKSWSKTGQKLKKWDIFGPDFERFRSDKWRLRVRKWVKVIIPLLWLRTDTQTDSHDRHTHWRTNFSGLLHNRPFGQIRNSATKSELVSENTNLQEEHNHLPIF